QVGEIPFYGFGPLIYHAFTSQSKRPFYATGSGFKGQTSLETSIIKMTENAGFKKQLDLKLYVPKDECLQPAFKIQVQEDSIKCNARELVLNSKQVSMQMLSNPRSVSDSGMSFMDAKGLLGDVTGIAKNATMALVEYPQLMKKAGLNFKAPESAAATPVDISDSI